VPCRPFGRTCVPGTGAPRTLPHTPVVTSPPLVTSPRIRASASSAAGPVLTAVLSFLAAVQALRLWEWRPGTPLSLSGDAPQVLVQVGAILRSDWYRVNDHVGAPFGLNQAWFSTADVLNFAGIKVLGLFTDSAATRAPSSSSSAFPRQPWPRTGSHASWASRGPQPW